MIPEAVPYGEPRLPAESTFWVPQLTEFDDEGIGFFRDVWTIIDVSSLKAQDVIDREQTLLQVVDSLATNAEDFDRLARCVERWDPEETEIDAWLSEILALETAIGGADSAQIGGLELGVAGLVYALAATGIVPAASCRGHTGPRPWSEWPVVFFATDESHARVLELSAQEAGCGFDIDPGRPELLVIGGRSIVNLMRFAAMLVKK